MGYVRAKADPLEKLGRPLCSRSVARQVMKLEYLLDGRSDALPRIEAAARILEDHLHLEPRGCPATHVAWHRLAPISDLT
jgi:hypothetical protein